MSRLDYPEARKLTARVLSYGRRALIVAIGTLALMVLLALFLVACSSAAPSVVNSL
jgi:hypothetical protein